MSGNEIELVKMISLPFKSYYTKLMMTKGDYWTEGIIETLHYRDTARETVRIEVLLGRIHGRNNSMDD